MENTLLHSTPIEELTANFVSAVKEELKNFAKDQVQSNESNEYLTRKETCKLLRITLVTLDTLTKNGDIKGYRIGGRILYKKDDITAAVKEIQSLKYKRRS